MRILHILIGNLNQGGLENNLMELYKNIDKKNIQFDFVVHSVENYYAPLVDSYGGNIYVVPYKSRNPFAYKKKFLEIFDNENQYDAVHLHTSYAIIIFDAILCKKVGIKNIVFHAHASGSNRIKQRVLNTILKPMIPFYSTANIAVSDCSAAWLYPRNIYKEKKYVILNNSIDIRKFIFNQNSRDYWRDILRIDSNNIVLGITGRLDRIKNHIFLLEIMEQLIDIDLNYKLLIIGDGPNKNMLEQVISEKKLNNNVILLGMHEDVGEIINTFDIFLFPSLFEGFGLSVIEAQINGLPCIINETLPIELNVTSLVIRKSIIQGCKQWVEQIQGMDLFRKSISLDVFYKFTGEYNARSLEEIYRGLD